MVVPDLPITNFADHLADAHFGCPILGKEVVQAEINDD